MHGRHDLNRPPERVAVDGAPRERVTTNSIRSVGYVKDHNLREPHLALAGRGAEMTPPGLDATLDSVHVPPKAERHLPGERSGETNYPAYPVAVLFYQRGKLT